MNDTFAFLSLIVKPPNLRLATRKKLQRNGNNPDYDGL